ncbi:MAG TPA: FtsQ-type POTRA domain-containing protein [Acidimicrobiales bacterium]|nr:FtsQ-type POTRA domain-containing protein [Acidimicrobiales bacterium]
MTGLRSTPVRSLPPPRMDPRIRKRRSAVRRHEGQRRLRVVLAVLGCAAVTAATLGIVHSPLLSVRHVTVSGGSHTSHESVLRATGLDRHPLMIDVDTGRLEQRLGALPWVAKATVRRDWPSTIGISVSERAPAAVVTTASGEWAVTDRTGRVLQRSSGTPAASRALPPLPSFRGEEQLPPPGSQLPPSSAPALRVLGALRWPMSSQVSAVDVHPDGDVSLTMAGGVVVLLGDASQLDRKLAATQTVLSQVRPSNVRTIDVRVPESPAVTPS